MKIMGEQESNPPKNSILKSRDQGCNGRVNRIFSVKELQ